MSAYDALRDLAGLPTFEEMLNRPAWMADGLCREYDRSLWFPTRGEDVTKPKAICNRCAVQSECLVYALRNGEQFGIWGGFTTRERRQTLRIQVTAA